MTGPARKPSKSVPTMSAKPTAPVASGVAEATTTAATAVAPAPAPVAKPTFDLSAVKVEKTQAPVRAGSNGGGSEPHPVLVSALTESWEARKVLREFVDDGVTRYTYIGEGRQIVVPEGAGKSLVNMVRKTAEYLNMGCSVRMDVDVQNGVTVDVVRFAAKTRKAKREPKA